MICLRGRRAGQFSHLVKQRLVFQDGRRKTYSNRAHRLSVRCDAKHCHSQPSSPNAYGIDIAAHMNAYLSNTILALLRTYERSGFATRTTCIEVCNALACGGHRSVRPNFHTSVYVSKRPGRLKKFNIICTD
eukprot:9488933-Pyramimonas_sp.AAC.2